MMDVSIIIVNYNTLSMTQECVNSVFEKTSGVNFEIILVDNASTDGSKEHFEKDSRIKYIYSKENLGFGRANNLGVEYASGDYVFFLNPDTILINNAVYILSEYLSGNKKVGAVGGNLFKANMQPNHSFKRMRPSILDDLDIALGGIISRIRYGRDTDFNHAGLPLNVAYICGADLMVPRNVLNKAGAFDEDFFMYYEDTELCHRIARCGLGIKSIPNAKIIHLDGGSSSSSVSRETTLLKSKAIYLKKIYSGIYPTICLILFYMYNVIGKNLYIVFKRNDKVTLLKNRISVLKELITKNH